MIRRPDPVPLRPAGLAAALAQGSRRALARAITLAESTRPEHRALVEQALRLAPPPAVPAVRVAVSGPPGAGKSTFIEALGCTVRAAGRRPAVLAVDPSSPEGGGAILGDKTRMDRLAADPGAFVRPSPSALATGGMSPGTGAAVRLCEAAGFDVILVETVGVGQGETAAAELADLFILLLSPGAGDELQGLKRGIVELADMVVINKADGDMAPLARRMAADYAGALRLLGATRPGGELPPPVMTCSAWAGDGVEAVWRVLETRHRELAAGKGLPARRAARAARGLWRETVEELFRGLQADAGLRRRFRRLEKLLRAGRLDSTAAARNLARHIMKAGGPGRGLS